MGTLGIVDDDVVETTNLQRQVVHGDADVGRAKTASAADAVHAVSPMTTVVEHRERLTADNALDVVADYDLVLDGADNFPTRYLVGDACARLGVPHVWGSVFRFDGQVSVWWAGEGPCYACVFPQQPAAGRRALLRGRRRPRGRLREHRVGHGDRGRQARHRRRRAPSWAGCSSTTRCAQSWDSLPVRADPACRVCGSGADATRPLGWASARGRRRRRGRPGRPGRRRARPTVTALGLRDVLARGDVLLVDVREAGEREVVTIPGSAWLPMDGVRAGTPRTPCPGSTCPAAGRSTSSARSGARSAEAADLLRSRGVEAVDVEGGVLAWVRDVDPSLPTY